jgi:NADH-quinone oxidoreductase subunit N
LGVLAPEIALCVTAAVVLCADLALPLSRKRFLAYASAAGMLVALAFAGLAEARLVGIEPSDVSRLDRGAEWVRTTVATDPLGGFFKVFAIVAGLIAILCSLDYVEQRLKRGQGEFYALLTLATMAIGLVAGSRDLIAIYVSLELLSITSYVLVASMKQDTLSTEGGIKYLLMGAVCSALMLYGLSLLYGLAGATDLESIARAVAERVADARSMTFSLPRGFSITIGDSVVFAALLLTLAGFGFKIALVPFHSWAPDAYEGAPTPFTAFLSVAPKAAGFALLVRFFMQGPLAAYSQWAGLLGVLAAVTMTVGNLVAIMQENMKRMLAYSSIAQAGYIIIGLIAVQAVELAPGQVVVPKGDIGLQGVIIYLMAYLFTNFGAFAVVILCTLGSGSESIRSYDGLARRAPFLAVALTVFFLSLAGVPPMAGFVGKLLVFAAAVRVQLYWLAVVGVVNSVISVYYYFNVVRRMFFLPPREAVTCAEAVALKVAIVVALVGTLLIGIYPEPFIALGMASVEFLGGL